MRVYALSDLHVDYEANARWVHGLSREDHVDDLLILAGDITHRRALLDEVLQALARRFRRVMFVPGNHDLWVRGEAPHTTSLHKFAEVAQTAADCGVAMQPQRFGELLVVPLLGWYDYSFARPDDELRRVWSDFHACRWPAGLEMEDVASHFLGLNPVELPADAAQGRVVTFSHFLPRIDLVPAYVPRRHRVLDPVLGSARIDEQLRGLRPEIHVYGHSHINRDVHIDGVRYVNNAFGYPHEGAIAARQLRCVCTV